VSQALKVGVPATEVARRAGHSVAVLLKIYAHCIDGQADAANKRIADALGGTDDSPDNYGQDDQASWHPAPVLRSCGVARQAGLPELLEFRGIEGGATWPLGSAARFVFPATHVAYLGLEGEVVQAGAPRSPLVTAIA